MMGDGWPTHSHSCRPSFVPELVQHQAVGKARIREELKHSLEHTHAYAEMLILLAPSLRGIQSKHMPTLSSKLMIYCWFLCVWTSTNYRHTAL